MRTSLNIDEPAATDTLTNEGSGRRETWLYSSTLKLTFRLKYTCNGQSLKSFFYCGISDKLVASAIFISKSKLLFQAIQSLSLLSIWRRLQFKYRCRKNINAGTFFPLCRLYNTLL